MKTSFFAALLVPAGLSAAEFDVTLIQTRVGKPLGDEVPFEVKPMGHEPGVAFSFLVRGQDLVSFKDNSVEITSFKLGDGREWARTRSGRANWKQEPFSKATEDGKIGSFTVTFPGDLLGTIEGASLSGSIVAVTASKPEERKITLTAGDKTRHEAGPFEISAGGGGGGFFGGNQEGTTIQVNGKLDAIIGVTVMDGGSELGGGGTSSFGETKSFHFGKAKGEELEVTLRYWTDLKEETIPFEIQPAAE